MGRTSAVAASSDLPTVTITDAMRCRIAHLAACPKACTLINLVYGSKNDRESLDDYNLRVTQLWVEVASLFVNNAAWQPSSSIEYYNTFAGLDPTVCPPSPGLDIPTIKSTWMSLRTDWSRLFNAIVSPTGASGTAGENLFKCAWENFINGNKMTFPNKPVTMYVFMLWFSMGKELPQWCRRTLNEKSQLRMGVPFDKSSLTSPKGNDRADRPETPPAGLDKLVAILQKKWDTPKEEDTATMQETAIAGRMTSIQSQLNALHAARTLNLAAGISTAALEDAIGKVTAKLVCICE